MAIGLIAVLIFLNSQFPAKQALIRSNTSVEKTFSVVPINFALGKLESHYIKHGAEFGDITQSEYLNRARALLMAQADGDVLEKMSRQDGDIIHFRRSTGEFAVMSPKGKIRTYFKASFHYFLGA